jgi:LmbE family N-acetylglucosaminyl deacetylase
VKAPICVLSPHRDDAALSLAATLDGLARRGTGIVILSCFTRSDWAPWLRPDLGVEEITRTREREDLAYARKLGRLCSVVDLGLLDAPLRRPGRSVFDPEEPGAAGPETLAVSLRRRSAGAAGLLVPLALGGHLDHLAVRSAALAVCRRRPLGFYEDLPYAFRLDDAEIAARVAGIEESLGRRLHPVRPVHPSPYAAWRRAARCYPSQFSAEDVEAMLGVLRHRGGERLWVTAGLRARLPR